MNTSQDQKLEIFQECLDIILQPLKAASYEGLAIVDTFGNPQQLLSSLTNSGLRLLPLPTASYNSPPLQSRCASIEHKHGLDTQKQQLTNSPKESKQVSVPDHVATIVSHCFHELNNPYACICSLINQSKIIKNPISSNSKNQAPQQQQKSSYLPIARRRLPSDSTETRRPTGARSSHSP